MVEISKGNKKMEVTRSAFNNFYKSAGWVESDVSFSETDEDWDEVLEEGQDEKPLSQMNNTELIEKAISLGLKIDGNATNKHLREMISGASR